jgi:hypothetical protein
MSYRVTRSLGELLAGFGDSGMYTVSVWTPWGVPAKIDVPSGSRLTLFDGTPQRVTSPPNLTGPALNLWANQQVQGQYAGAMTAFWTAAENKAKADAFVWLSTHPNPAKDAWEAAQAKARDAANAPSGPLYGGSEILPNITGKQIYEAQQSQAAAIALSDPHGGGLMMTLTSATPGGAPGGAGVQSLSPETTQVTPSDTEPVVSSSATNATQVVPGPGATEPTEVLPSPDATDVEPSDTSFLYEPPADVQAKTDVTVSEAEANARNRAQVEAKTNLVSKAADVLTKVGDATGLVPGLGPIVSAIGMKPIAFLLRLVGGENVADAFNDSFTLVDLVGYASLVPGVGQFVVGVGAIQGTAVGFLATAGAAAKTLENVGVSVHLPTAGDIGQAIYSLGEAVVSTAQSARTVPLPADQSRVQLDVFNLGVAYGNGPMTSPEPDLSAQSKAAPNISQDELKSTFRAGAISSQVYKMSSVLGADGAKALAMLSSGTYRVQANKILAAVSSGQGLDATALGANLPVRVQRAYDIGRQSQAGASIASGRDLAIKEAAGRAFEQWAGMKPGTAAPATLAALTAAALKGDAASVARTTGLSAGAAAGLVKQVATAAAEAGSVFDLGVVAQKADHSRVAVVVRPLPLPTASQAAEQHAAVVATADANRSVVAPVVQAQVARTQGRTALGIAIVGLGAAALVALLWPKKKTTTA